MTSQEQLPVHDLPSVPCFTLGMRQDPDTVEVVLSGALDELTVGHLDDSLQWVRDQMTQVRVVVDVTGVSRLEPCAIESLLRARTELAAGHRTLALRGDDGALRKLFAAAGLPAAVVAIGVEG